MASQVLLTPENIRARGFTYRQIYLTLQKEAKVKQDIVLLNERLKRVRKKRQSLNPFDVAKAMANTKKTQLLIDGKQAELDMLKQARMGTVRQTLKKGKKFEQVHTELRRDMVDLSYEQQRKIIEANRRAWYVTIREPRKEQVALSVKSREVAEVEQFVLPNVTIPDLPKIPNPFKGLGDMKNLAIIGIVILIIIVGISSIRK